MFFSVRRQCCDFRNSVSWYSKLTSRLYTTALTATCFCLSSWSAATYIPRCRHLRYVTWSYWSSFRGRCSLLLYNSQHGSASRDFVKATYALPLNRAKLLHAQSWKPADAVTNCIRHARQIATRKCLVGPHKHNNALRSRKFPETHNYDVTIEWEFLARSTHSNRFVGWLLTDEKFLQITRTKLQSKIGWWSNFNNGSIIWN